MLFMFHTQLRRPADMPAAEFYGVWHREAVASLEALEAGAILQIWKVPGRDDVIGVMDVADADALDRGLHQLPIWSTGSDHLVERITWTPLRSYASWTDDLAGLAALGSAPA